MRLVAAAFATALPLLLNACGSSSGPGGQGPARPAAEDSPIWLPPLAADRVDRPADPKCQLQAVVALRVANEDLTGVRLADRVVGGCEILVKPNERLYELKPAGGDCGTKKYAGTRETPQGPVRIEVLDHGARVCDDRTYGMIEITETDAAGSAKRFAGSWN